ncbi:MAG: alpha/beta fold hydrolase, partial [Planctomycetia bacterium]|nr:alpha/beta fold hydrolase [Planctomycetia bacterium]
MTAITFRHPLDFGRSGRFARSAVLLVATLALLTAPGSSHAMDRAEAVKLSRKYLTSDDEEERHHLLRQLARYNGTFEPVLRELQTVRFEPVVSGYLPEEHFTVSDLLDKHPDDLLYFTIPKSYRPDRPTGLVIFMHGGGRSTSRYAPRYSLDFPENSDHKENSQLGDLFDSTGMIAVGPSSPDKRSYYRWCLRESDEYLADVICECKSRFHIDDDRVLLLGHSMGGFGAYHHVQRQPDRFAAVIVNAGSWWLAHWPVIRGTPLFIV